MHMTTFGMLVSLTLWDCPAPQDQKDPGELLQTLSQELRRAIKTAGKDLDVRLRLTKLAKATFDKDLASAPASKTPKSAWEYHAEFLERLAVADTHFRGDPDKAERAIWIVACKAAYTRELASCKETSLAGAEAPATDQVYYDLNQAVAKVAKRFAQGADDYDKAGYDGARQAFVALVGKSKAPQADPKLLYTKWLSDTDRLYPLSTDDQKKQNTTPNQILKTASKTALDRMLAAPK
jgi:hypothetical protein